MSTLASWTVSAILMVGAVLYYCLMWWDSDPGRRLLERFPKKEIMSRNGDRLYLTRYFLLGGEFSRWALMVHHMHMPDDDACHHDHPWNFWTLILKGGYVEEITTSFRAAVAGWARRLPIVAVLTWDTVVVAQHNRPGTFHYRPAEHTHRIAALPTGDCWTLVWRTKRHRGWGFHTKQGWVHWREFINLRKVFGAVWCGPDTPKDQV